MGASSSTTYDPTTIASASQNVAMSLTQDCTINATDTQLINAIVAAGNITISCPTIDITNLSNTMVGSGTYKCFQKSITGQQIMNDVGQYLGGSANTTASGAFSSGITNIGPFTYSNEYISSSFDAYANCLNNINSSQVITSLQSGGNIDITCDSTTNGVIDISKLSNNQSINNIATCTQNLENSFNGQNSIQQSVAPSITTASTGLDTGGIIGIVIACVVGIFGIALIIFLIKRKVSISNQTSRPHI